MSQGDMIEGEDSKKEVESKRKGIDFRNLTVRIGKKRITLKDFDLNKENIRRLVKKYRKRYKKYRFTPLIFALTGSLLIIFALVWNIWLFPDLVVIPDGMEMDIELIGTARIINESNGEFSEIKVKATLTSSFGKSRGEKIDVTQTLQLVNSETGEDLISKYEGLIESSRSFTVNKKTGTIVRGGSGQMLLPMGNIEKTDYSFFNLDTNSTGTIEYSHEAERSGLDTLRFDMKLEDEFLGEYRASGPVPATDIFFNGNTTYWFEKRIGLPVDAEREMNLYIDLPDLYKIPDGLVQQRIILGNATLVDTEDTTKTRDIRMMVMFNITTVLQLDNTLVLWENITAYDAETGEKLPEIYQVPNYERLISLDQYSFQHVYDKRLEGSDKYQKREGYWLFPFGRLNENRTLYRWFNQVTNSTMDCVFQGKEFHKGTDTYRFRCGATNFKMKPQDSKMENMIMIFDGFIDYWADVETGIVHDTRINFTFSVLSVNDPDDFENKIRLSSVDCSMSQESLDESMINLTQARGFFPYSNKRLVVFSANMELSPESREELSELAESMSTQYFLGDIILPYSCAAIGVAVLFFGGYLKRKRDIFYLE